MSKLEEIKIENSKFQINVKPKSRNSIIKSNINQTHIKCNNNITFHKNNYINNNKILNSKEISTTKIDYRHYKSYPIQEIIPFSLNSTQEEKNELYWLVTYDKLIKTKKILKILNSDNNSRAKPIYTNNDLKIKYLKIPDYQIFYVKGFDKPFVRPYQESFILAKLYLLSLDEINKIFNYINKTKDKVNIDKYINLGNMNNDFCEFIDIKKKDNNDDISYPYCYFYHVGTFMNKSMILFTNTFNYINDETNKIDKLLLYSLPSSKKLYKLIKLLMKSFPEYSPNYFLEYLINRNLYKNYEEKKKEILHLLSLINNSIPNKALLNKVLRETIIGIQANTPISGGSLHIDSDKSSKSTMRLENKKRKSCLVVKNPVGVKNSLKSNTGLFISGQIGTINYLSTNQTLMPHSSINTFKNSFKNNMLSISIPYEINNANKEKDSFCAGLISSTNQQNITSDYSLIQKLKESIKNKKLEIKNLKDKGNIKNSGEREKIDINKILNKRKIEFKLSIKNSGNTIYKNEKKKNNKINNNKNYHTPKKKKKIKYYK